MITNTIFSGESKNSDEHNNIIGEASDKYRISIGEASEKHRKSIGKVSVSKS